MIEGTMEEVSIDLIDPDVPELRSMIAQEKFDELVDSIRALGIIQPLRLAKNGQKYEIVCGHRRYQAAKSLGLAAVPAVVVEGSAHDYLVDTVHENLMREDVNPMDLAQWLQDIKMEKGLTVEALSQMFGKSGGWAGHYLGLLKCDGDIQVAVAQGKIDVISARRLQTVPDAAVRHSLLGHVIQSGASQAVIAGWVKKEKASAGYVGSALGPAEPGADEETVEIQSFLCGWCNEKKEVADQLMMSLCSVCYQSFREAAKVEQSRLTDESAQDSVVDETKVEPAAPADGTTSGDGGKTGNEQKEE